MITTITIACLLAVALVQSLEIHYIKKAIDMLADDVWHIEENQEKDIEEK
jgi:hypothetical protein